MYQYEDNFKKIPKGLYFSPSKNYNTANDVHDAINIEDFRLNFELLQNKIARLNALIPNDDYRDVTNLSKLSGDSKFFKNKKIISDSYNNTNTNSLMNTKVNEKFNREAMRGNRNLTRMMDSKFPSTINNFFPSNKNNNDTSNYNSAGLSHFNNSNKSNFDSKLSETKKKINSLLKKHDKNMPYSKYEQNVTTTNSSDNVANNLDNNYTFSNSSYMGSQKLINKKNENSSKYRYNPLQTNTSNNTYLYTESVQQFCITAGDKKGTNYNSENVSCYPSRHKKKKETILSVSISQSISEESLSISNIVENLVDYIDENQCNNIENIGNIKEKFQERNQLIQNLKTNKFTTIFDRYKDDTILANPNLTNRNSEISEFLFLNSKQSSLKHLKQNEALNQVRLPLLFENEAIPDKNLNFLPDVKSENSLLCDLKILEKNINESFINHSLDKEDDLKFEKNDNMIRKVGIEEIEFLEKIAPENGYKENVYPENDCQENEISKSSINEDFNESNDEQRVNRDSENYIKDEEKIKNEDECVKLEQEEDIDKDLGSNYDKKDEIDDVKNEFTEENESQSEKEDYSEDEKDREGNKINEEFNNINNSRSNKINYMSNARDEDFRQVFNPYLNKTNKKKVKFSDDKQIITYEEKKNIQNLFIIKDDGNIVNYKKRDFNQYLRNLKNLKPKSILIKKKKINQTKDNDLKISESELALKMLNNLISECDNENSLGSKEEEKENVKKTETKISKILKFKN